MNEVGQVFPFNEFLGSFTFYELLHFLFFSINNVTFNNRKSHYIICSTSVFKYLFRISVMNITT